MTLFVDHLVTARSLEEKSAEDNKLWLNTVGFGAAIKATSIPSAQAFDLIPVIFISGGSFLH